MDWRHEVNPDWMIARRDVLTATELSSCVAAWKRANKDQKSGEQLFVPFAQLWAEKQSIGEPDTWSKGPAARGHILEPYAVKDWNKNFVGEYGESQRPMFYHWDDVIIKRNGLGWSPDALDIIQDTWCCEVTEIDGRLNDGYHTLVGGLPNALLEIKSYEPKKHMKCMMTPPEKLDERWQVACGMHVLPSIQDAYILFYSIDTDLSFFWHYTRDKLEEELEQIEEMVGVWNKNTEKLANNMPVRFNRTYTEDQVYEEYQESMEDILKI